MAQVLQAHLSPGFLTYDDYIQYFLPVKPIGFQWTKVACLAVRIKPPPPDGIQWRRFYGGPGMGEHAEQKAMDYLKELDEDEEYRVTFLMNYSPCVRCAGRIARFFVPEGEQQQNGQCCFILQNIKFCADYTDFQQALPTLQNLPIEPFTLDYWIELLDEINPNVVKIIPQPLPLINHNVPIIPPPMINVPIIPQQLPWIQDMITALQNHGLKDRMIPAQYGLPINVTDNRFLQKRMEATESLQEIYNNIRHPQVQQQENDQNEEDVEILQGLDNLRI